MGFQQNKLGGNMQEVHFDTIYDHVDYFNVLWKLLLERESHVNISHSKMPTWQQHTSFIISRPYLEWDFIWAKIGTNFQRLVGTIYITRQNEIGIHIFKEYQNRGYGRAALKHMLELCPSTKFLANINPTNEKSIGLFKTLGFEHIQNTYRLK